MRNNRAVEPQERISHICDILERFLAEATPGPWAFNSYSTVLSAPRVQEYEIDDTVETNVCVVPREGRGDLGTPQGQKDGDLIAAMRNALPELIAEVRRLREWRNSLLLIRRSAKAKYESMADMEWPKETE